MAHHPAQRRRLHRHRLHPTHLNTNLSRRPATKLTPQNPPAVRTIAGPAGISTLNEISSPTADAPTARVTATVTCPARERDQCRAAIAGSIISPTDIRVPNAVNPETTHRTTNARNAPSHSPPARAGKPGSRISGTIGRHIT